MKKRLFALALLLIGLMSCNSDEELVKANTDYAEPGTAVIIPNFYSIKTLATKADLERTAAFDDEKEIKSIAFFVKVGDDVNLQLFQSTKTTGTVDGLLEQLKETVTGTKGNYTAKFKMKMNGDQKVIMFALANYAENNLDLSSIATETDLKAAMSNAITDKKNPEKPLLMLGSLEKNDLKEGEAAEVSFKMDRLVARVDIVNEAYNADAAKGFRLTSAQVLNGKAQSSLLPDQTSVADGIVVLEEMEKKDKVVDIMEDVNVVGQRLDTLYMYENTNTANATAIQVNGTFNGTPVAQRIEFLKEDPATGNKTQLSIGRNNLYTIKIHPSQDSTSVSFKIEVEDWTNAKGDTMTIEPKKEKPVLSAIEGTATAATVTGKRIDIDATNLTNLSGILTFTAEGNQDSKVAVQYVGRKGATWLNGDAIVQGELEGFTKASPILKRKYTIDFSNAAKELTDNNTVPSDALILVQNANAATKCDTIRVCFRPDYNGMTGVQPVLMKGKDGKEYFWAPINVGATTTTNTAVATGNITAACGQLFQWGRNSGVDANSAGGDVYEGDDRPVGVEGALPDMTTWANKHIKSNSSDPNTQGNWLQFVADQDNPDGSSMVKDAWYQQLWNKNEGKDNTEVVKTTNDPCPQGWRVPTMDEWKAIGADNSTKYTWDASNLNLSIPGKESGKNLVLPIAGNRNSSSGASGYQGSVGLYWSSSVPSGKTFASYVFFNSTGTLGTSTSSRADGFSVRCVQK